MCRPSFRGIAYFAASNFMARGLILIGSFISILFTYEMKPVYSAHIETKTVLLYQSLYMIPVFVLGYLVFLGIEKDSFNLVLYPSLMLLFVILLRYGAEIALIVIMWKHNKFSENPTVIFDLLVDLSFIAVLLLYVYFTLSGDSVSSNKPSIGHLINQHMSLNSTVVSPPQQRSRSSSIQPTRGSPAPPPVPEHADNVHVSGIFQKQVPPPPFVQPPLPPIPPQPSEAKFQYPRRKQPSEIEDRPLSALSQLSQIQSQTSRPNSRPNSRPSSFIGTLLPPVTEKTKESLGPDDDDEDDYIISVPRSVDPASSSGRLLSGENNIVMENEVGTGSGLRTNPGFLDEEEEKLIPSELISDLFKTTAV